MFGFVFKFFSKGHGTTTYRNRYYSRNEASQQKTFWEKYLTKKLGDDLYQARGLEALKQGIRDRLTEVIGQVKHVGQELTQKREDWQAHQFERHTGKPAHDIRSILSRDRDVIQMAIDNPGRVISREDVPNTPYAQWLIEKTAKEGGRIKWTIDDTFLDRLGANPEMDKARDQEIKTVYQTGYLPGVYGQEAKGYVGQRGKEFFAAFEHDVERAGAEPQWSKPYATQAEAMKVMQRAVDRFEIGQIRLENQQIRDFEREEAKLKDIGRTPEMDKAPEKFTIDKSQATKPRKMITPERDEQDWERDR